MKSNGVAKGILTLSILAGGYLGLNAGEFSGFNISDPKQVSENQLALDPVWPITIKESKLKGDPVWPIVAQDKNVALDPVWPIVGKEKKLLADPVWPVKG